MASASFHVYVVAAVRVSDVFTVKRVEKTVRKYDPNTGRPYDEVVVEFVPNLFGRDRPGLEPDPDEWGSLLGPLKVFDTGNDSADDPRGGQRTNPYARFDYTKHFIGLRLNQPYREAGRHFDTEEAVYEFMMTPMRDALQTVHAEMMKLGNAVMPKMFVIKSVSY